ncbi:PhnE/PtxC family ABC transporter permease [Natronomonas sp.]|uniref:PhnE/PtxC family ABC transporter permease n=1 Tax=Natronomonas sp. TaxID=2184060 RepID=UPI002FC2D3E6
MSGEPAEESGTTTVDETLARIERNQRVRRILLALGVVLLGIVTAAGMTFIGFRLADIVRTFPGFIGSLVDFLPPNFVDFTTYTSRNEIEGPRAIWESLIRPWTFIESLQQQDGLVGLSVITIAIGFCGTVLGFPLALLFGVLGSERVTPFPFNFIFRGTMSTIRAIPALVWVLIYIPLAGLGPVGALMAVATDTVGNLGRLFTDELEEIDDGPIEAIGSTGSSGSQRVVFGMLSQVFTSFIAWTLYIFEINVRIAVSLGVVGAGGIGLYLNERFFGFLEFGKGMAAIIMVIFIVLSVEMISSRLRARLRPSEHEKKGFIDTLRDLGNGNKWLGFGDR